jgi:hypothetical protein
MLCYTTTQLFFVATGALMLLLLAPMPPALGLLLLCATRASALGFNQSLWVVGAQTFPTPVRATGLGLVTCFARLAGIAAANSLAPLWAASRLAAIAVCATGCALAAALVGLLPRGAATPAGAAGEMCPASGAAVSGTRRSTAEGAGEAWSAELQPTTPRTTPPASEASPQEALGEAG